MGGRRNGAAIGPAKFDRAVDHRRDREHGGGADSRVRADAGRDRRQRETEKTEQRLGAKIWALSNRGTQALYRQTISNETRSGVYRIGRFVSRRTLGTFVGSVVEKSFQAPGIGLYSGLVGR